MPVIIKDFQVVNDPPDNQALSSTPPYQEPSKGAMPPPAKKIAQTLRHIKERMARVHAD